MGQNWSIPNPIGFLPGHEMTPDTYEDPMFGPGPYDNIPGRDPWPDAWNLSPGAWGPGLVPPHGGLLGTNENAQGTLVTFQEGKTTKTLLGKWENPNLPKTKTKKKNKDKDSPQGITQPLPETPLIKVQPLSEPPKRETPPSTTNRVTGRLPTPPSLPVRETHPHLNMTTWREKYASLLTPVPGSSSSTPTPAGNTASRTVSSSWKTGESVTGMGNISSELLEPLVGFQVVFFLWTKILTIGQSLDSWWTSLSFLGGTPECNGQNLQFQTCRHSPTSCPATCPGFRWMCLRRFIIYLLVLLLCLICLLVLLDWRGLLPVCPIGPVSGTSTRCNTCTTSAEEITSWPSCCCSKASGGNCTCWPIPSSWALGRFLWGLALARFSWLNSLVPWLQWFVGFSPTAWLLLIWMMWYWGPGLLSIWSPFMPLFALFFLIWGYI
uniref:Large envelope protein n=1 Tax=Bat Hepatitis B virus TaxID=1401315 RepID=A0A2H4RID9_HBV|nr:surface protein [Bat Hepatitis B virus]ATY50236.1 surface protein [Bat Hepatitis B virus]ATY50240.1 surface protein [Bat Hepatitis B virus]